MFSASLFLTLIACDRTGLPLRPQVSDAPFLDDLGVLEVLPSSEWGVFDPIYNSSGELSSCESTFNGRDNEKVLYPELGIPTDPSIIGGAVASFIGTGGRVCVVVDPEAVSWQQNLSLDSTAKGRYYADRATDDADLDIAVGLSAYYTGSPGVSLGDFVAIYTDEVGGEHELPFQECFPGGFEYHAGRGVAEYCTIDTDEREGVPYTVQIKNFSVPIDDSVTSYAVGVFEGSCDDVISGAYLDETVPEENFCGLAFGVGSECALEGEGTKEDDDGAFLELEEAYCSARDNTLYKYCEDHLEDENPPCNLGYWENHPQPVTDEEEEE